MAMAVIVTAAPHLNNWVAKRQSGGLSRWHISVHSVCACCNESARSCVQNNTKPAKRCVMNRYLVSLALVAGLAALCSPAMAQTTSVDPGDPGHVHYAWDSVTRADPAHRSVQVASPQQSCQQQSVARRDDGDNTADTVLDAAVGDQVAGRDDRMIQDAVTRCRQVQGVSQERRIVGYNVEYRYRGRVYNSRLGYDPGTRLRVRVTVTPDD